jgi:hypothetical protein
VSGVAGARSSSSNGLGTREVNVRGFANQSLVRTWASRMSPFDRLARMYALRSTCWLFRLCLMRSLLQPIRPEYDTETHQRSFMLD